TTHLAAATSMWPVRPCLGACRLTQWACGVWWRLWVSGWRAANASADGAPDLLVLEWLGAAAEPDGLALGALPRACTAVCALGSVGVRAAHRIALRHPLGGVASHVEGAAAALAPAGAARVLERRAFGATIIATPFCIRRSIGIVAATGRFPLVDGAQTLASALAHFGG